MAYRLGVDVGGTFTDLFLVSEGNGGAQFRVKTPSTPHDPSEGVLTGVRRICDEAGIGVAQWLEERLGRELEGQVYKAGTFAPVAGYRKGTTA